jgi:hypothetical protein
LLALVFLGGIWLGTGRSAVAQTNYPLQPVIEVRDHQGNLVTAAHSACPRDGITVFSNGWKNLTDVDVTFHSDPVHIGTYKADDAGAVQFMFHLDDVENGLHTVRLEGTGANGAPRTVEAVVNCNCTPTASTTTTTLPPGSTTTTTAVGGVTTTTSGGIGGGTGGGNGGTGGGTQVLGSTLNNNNNRGALGQGAFAKTGTEARQLFVIAFDLIAVGLALVFASKRAARTRVAR